MYHTLIIVGNVGKDAEMRYTPSGQAVTSFSVADSRKYVNSGGEQVEETAWFRITTWGKLAENCNQYVKKGMKVLIEGRLTPDKNTGGPRVWESNGKHGATFEVNAAVVRFLSSRAESGMVEAAQQTGGVIAEEDIPF